MPRCLLSRLAPVKICCRCCSALTLLVAGVAADHQDPPVTADHLALVTDLLDARLNLHVVSPRPGTRVSPGRSVVPAATCSGRRCGRETGRTAKAPPRPDPRAGCG